MNLHFLRYRNSYKGTVINYKNLFFYYFRPISFFLNNNLILWIIKNINIKQIQSLCSTPISRCILFIIIITKTLFSTLIHLLLIALLNFKWIGRFWSNWRTLGFVEWLLLLSTLGIEFIFYQFGQSNSLYHSGFLARTIIISRVSLQCDLPI